MIVESRSARMVRSSRYKYIVYDSGKNREQLIDLEKDPGEMQNLAADPANAPVLAEHRRQLVHWYQSHNEKLDPKYTVK